MPLRNKALNREVYTTQEADSLLSDKADESDLTVHTGSTSNPHAVTAVQVGLGNVDNTTDLNKPISTATQNALDGLDSRLTSHEQLGHFVGSFATRASVPNNISGFPGGIFTNDFITVRADETHGGESTRYTVTAINLGVIDWTYDITLSTDISGKLDINGTAVAATKLATARTITVTPTATAAASFDGTANVTPGVSVTTAAGTAANTLPAVAATALQTWLVTARNCLAWLVARFDASGNANKALEADKLSTARTITVTSTATAAGSFDGSANITPGVSVTTAAGTAASTLPGTAATNLQGWLVICRNCLSWLTTRVAAIPAGGTTGQMLAKSSDSDWATSWQSGTDVVTHFWSGGTINVLATSIPTAKVGDYLVITSADGSNVLGTFRATGSVWKILTTTSLENTGNIKSAASMFTATRHAIDDADLRLATPGGAQMVMGAFRVSTGANNRQILTPNVTGATYRIALFCGECWATRNTSSGTMAGATPNAPSGMQALVAFTHQFAGTGIVANTALAFVGPTGDPIGTSLAAGRQWTGIYFITRSN